MSADADEAVCSPVVASSSHCLKPALPGWGRWITADHFDPHPACTRAVDDLLHALGAAQQSADDTWLQLLPLPLQQQAPHGLIAHKASRSRLLASPCPCRHVWQLLGGSCCTSMSVCSAQRCSRLSVSTTQTEGPDQCCCHNTKLLLLLLLLCGLGRE